MNMTLKDKGVGNLNYDQILRMSAAMYVTEKIEKSTKRLDRRLDRIYWLTLKAIARMQ